MSELDVPRFPEDFVRGVSSAAYRRDYLKVPVVKGAISCR